VFRDFVLFPLIILYMSCLVLAAWPREVRPPILDGAHSKADELLESVSIRPGMAVFKGSRSKKKSIARARCTVVEGVDSSGRTSRLYPTEPCPKRGMRWKPVIYPHMILHWTAKLREGDFTANLSAMGDHFCQRAGDQEFTHVEIKKVHTTMDYASGRMSTHSYPVGEVECR
jgi:hypothetical protein